MEWAQLNYGWWTVLEPHFNEAYREQGEPKSRRATSSSRKRGLRKSAQEDTHRTLSAGEELCPSASILSVESIHPISEAACALGISIEWLRMETVSTSP